ncbi:hypothetical protein GCM10007424_17030 [Flavobacterium suaedae]|uniref:Uncharacterized protein n=1 Tax=Flavobacterium suaedae TaxID=1767027 RepID=A0ABQ1JUP7_9FLAO|nr:hypothetical protein [Flavobacterium suaedae]GGB77560.1 hypothetical protein GCM10007424_17030 [Flavobacterium suaedae]
MCDFSKGIRLCTCESETIKFREKEYYRKVKGELIKIHNKKNDKIPLIYIWQLFRYKGKKKDCFEMGSYKMPQDDIGKGLNDEWVVLNLNIENCFDFDYTPKEGDNLLIRQNEDLSPYMSFIYKSDKWIIDHYYPFDIEIEYLTEGLLKTNEG